MKRNILLIVAVILIIGLIVYFEPNKVEVSKNEDVNEIKGLDKPAVKIIEDVEYPLSPELAGLTGYINTEEGIKISGYSGKVVLIDFWTYTCINCIRTLPYLTEWYEKYNDKGLVIIGVHAPEFDFEKDIENVKKAVERYEIEYPVVLDNDRGTWEAFNNRFWPAKYLIDSEGYIRYYHFGEGAYEETEMKIKELLEEAGENTDGIEVTEETNVQRYQTTPELYAGSLFALPRSQYIGNKKTPVRLEEYVLPSNLERKNVIYLDGLWMHNIDNLQLDGSEGVIALDYTASEINIVAFPQDDSKEVLMEVLIDGKYVSEEDAGSDVLFENGKAFVKVDENRLYNVYKGIYDNRRLDLKVSEGFRFNAFTFG